jgi:hypothetical protein
MTILVLLFGMVFTGCVTSAGRFDATTPPEDDRVLVIGKNAKTLIKIAETAMPHK